MESVRALLLPILKRSGASTASANGSANYIEDHSEEL